MTARCLETRRTPEGFRRRRYEQDGVRFTTIEVPMEEWLRLAENPQREAARRLLAAGTKPLAVAVETGLSETTIYRIRADLPHP